METLVLSIDPDFPEVFVAEVSTIGDDLLVIGDFVDGVGCPFGTQDDPVEEDRFFFVSICLEVQDNTQVVQILAETQHGLFVGLVEALVSADVVELRDFDVGFAFGVVFQDVADFCPVFGDGHTDVIQGGDAVL